jgi:hypothetical protein
VQARFHEWEIDAARRQNQEKQAQLVQKYYQYVNNIERGASGENSVLEKIRSKDYTPEDLKRRVEAMLRRTDLPIR